jgi:hypothetical protein
LHYDLALKYAAGHMPRGLEPFSDEALRVIPYYNTSEYNRLLPDGSPPPPLWSLPADQADSLYKTRRALWAAHGNFEGSQPPLYYAAAAVWYRLGRSLGFGDGHLLYWLRALGAVAYGLLVWLASLWMKRLYPDDAFYRLGVPLLAAVFPQQAAYSINNDCFSPLVAGAAFFALLELRSSRAPSAKSCLVAGLLTSAAVLVKISNVGVVAVFGAVLVGMLKPSLKKDWRAPALLAAAAAAPLAFWCAWNLFAIGEPTGGAFKAAVLGWTPRPLGTYLSHPILTPGGLAYFLRNVAITFWRGEFWWHGAQLRSPWLDFFYVLSTCSALAYAGFSLSRSKKKAATPADDASALALLGLGASVLFLVAMSVVYLFPEGGGYPNRADPYIYSGRLIWGLLIPFLLLFLRALDGLCAALRARRWIALGLVVAAIATGEAALAAGAFSSPSNWFHLPASSSAPAAGAALERIGAHDGNFVVGR